MYGAIFGDIVGSVYEFDKGEKTKLFRLFTEDSTFTDDTVMTLAVAQALLEVGPAAEPDAISQAVAAWMRRLGQRYPNAGYGGKFAAWLSDPAATAYGSYGNGSAMRVSPAGWFYDTIERTREVARATAAPTHNHPEGIKGAEAVASVIFLARNGWSRPMIRGYITREFGYDLKRTLDEIRPGYKMDATCQGSVPEAIIAFLEAEDFEDAVRGAVSIGGDTDTTACMAGAMAEAYFGIPEEFAEEVRDRLPDDLLAIFNQEQKLKDALKARWDVDTTIAAHNASPSTESMNKVLNALSVRMKAGGLLYIPVEHIGAEAVDKYTPIPIPKPGEQVARRSIATNDGKRWVVAFTSEEELKKKENEPTEYLGEPAVFTFQMASRIPDCAGLAINPWGERFFMSQDLINRFMELTIHPKKPEA